MERRVWERPLTEVQKFEANEYVAACGDSGVAGLVNRDIMHVIRLMRRIPVTCL